MSQHDYDIANAAGAAFRADLNLALLAILGANSGASEPTTKIAYMLWADTTSGILKQRNSANTAWINILLMATGSPSQVVQATESASGKAEIATQAEADAGTDDLAIMTAKKVRNHSTVLHKDITKELTKGFYCQEVALTPGSTVAIDLTLSNIFTLNVNQNMTLLNPTVVGAGCWYIYATVDATGGRSLTLDSNYNTIQGGFDEQSNVVNIIVIICDGTEFDVFYNQRV